MDDLRAGRLSWRPYLNRRIGEFLKELKLTEGRGTGIPKIMRAMRANGSPMPEFETNDNRDFFIATLPVHPAFLQRNASGNLVTGLVTEEEKVTKPVTKPNEKEGEYSRRILEFCRVERSRRELQQELKIKHASYFQRTYLVPLLAEELLEPTIPLKPTSPLQKYLTTEKGLASL